MNFWSNLLGYHAVWLTAVIAAAHGLTWPGLVALALFAACQLGLSRNRLLDGQLMAWALVCGLILDGALAASGWIAYAEPEQAVPPGGAPLWILTLWAAFALTLNHSLRFLQDRLWVASVLGAVGGPLAYWGATRAWGVARFVNPEWHALVALTAGWAVALPLLAAWARRRANNPGATAPATHGSPS